MARILNLASWPNRTNFLNSRQESISNWNYCGLSMLGVRPNPKRANKNW